MRLLVIPSLVAQMKFLGCAKNDKYGQLDVVTSTWISTNSAWLHLRVRVAELMECNFERGARSLWLLDQAKTRPRSALQKIWQWDCASTWYHEKTTHVENKLLLSIGHTAAPYILHIRNFPDYVDRTSPSCLIKLIKQRFLCPVSSTKNRKSLEWLGVWAMVCNAWPFDRSWLDTTHLWTNSNKSN